MIRSVAKYARRFLRREDGTATVEFAIVFVPMFTMLLSAVELGMIQLHHSMLERAVDMTVRDIRLGTGSAPQHNDIKNTICTRARFLDSCDDLRIEMVTLDPRSWDGVSRNPDCTDRSQPVAPVRSFVNGADNALMFLRACAKYDPIFPNIGMGQNLIVDGAGQYSLVTTSAFVQEPR